MVAICKVFYMEGNIIREEDKEVSVRTCETKEEAIEKVKALYDRPVVKVVILGWK